MRLRQQPPERSVPGRSRSCKGVALFKEVRRPFKHANTDSSSMRPCRHCNESTLHTPHRTPRTPHFTLRTPHPIPFPIRHLLTLATSSQSPHHRVRPCLAMAHLLVAVLEGRIIMAVQASARHRRMMAITASRPRSSRFRKCEMGAGRGMKAARSRTASKQGDGLTPTVM